MERVNSFSIFFQITSLTYPTFDTWFISWLLSPRKMIKTSIIIITSKLENNPIAIWCRPFNNRFWVSRMFCLDQGWLTRGLRAIFGPHWLLAWPGKLFLYLSVPNGNSVQVDISYKKSNRAWHTVHVFNFFSRRCYLLTSLYLFISTPALTPLFQSIILIRIEHWRLRNRCVYHNGPC